MTSTRRRTMIKEREVSALSGGFMCLILLAALFGSIACIIHYATQASAGGIIGSVLTLVVSAISLVGLTVVNPNQSQVVQLFGSYTGTLHKPGFWWVNPFTTRRKISVRVRNFESAKLKVNDHDGNPIEIAAVVVWRVVDTAEAMFEVDNYENFVKVQCEAALRNLATSYPYDAHQDAQLSLRANITEVAEQLRTEIEARLQKAGVHVIEARISHL